MAARPWVTPDDVKSYSSRDSVKNRENTKLLIDISRAEMYVISYTNNRFDDSEKYPEIPDPVKTAVLLLAESYAASEAEPIEHGGNYKSGSVDDYSFTVADTAFKAGNLDLASLLGEFVQIKGNINLIMRKL